MQHPHRSRHWMLAGLLALLPIASQATPNDPLRFPVTQFKLKMLNVKTSQGQHHLVRYRLYQHLPYVLHPQDKAYQSLDVQVPVSIDGIAIDARQAPILLNIKVGGYLSVNNAHGGQPNMAALGALGVPPGPHPDHPGKPGPDGQPIPPTAGGPLSPPGQAHGIRHGIAPGMGMGDDKASLALAAGYVVVTPGVRGWDNRDASGHYFGKAPAAIVDLKAAVRYIRYNTQYLPGNPNWIVSAGCSAGGALSALVGMSGNQPDYQPYLTALGAAEAPDNVFASACYSPIADINHADMSYEWQFGDLPVQGKPVDPTLSAHWRAGLDAYLASLALQGRHGFGVLTSANYGDYLYREYLQPAATAYLAALPPTQRTTYLASHRWMHWQNGQAQFSFADFRQHGTRMKGLPAFDDFQLNAAETQLFGHDTLPAQHFTLLSLQHVQGSQAALAPELVTRINLMNPHYFLQQPDRGIAPHWWLRNGSRDNNNDLTVMVNLATGLENRGKQVNSALFWDGGHCADTDPEGMVRWIAQITGYRVHR